MTWVLVIGAWVVFALLAGLVLGRMIRRADVREAHPEDAGTALSELAPSPGPHLSVLPLPPVLPETPGEGAHPME